MGQGNAPARPGGAAAGVGYAAGDDEPELYDEAWSVVEGRRVRWEARGTSAAGFFATTIKVYIINL